MVIRHEVRLFTIEHVAAFAATHELNTRNYGARRIRSSVELRENVCEARVDPTLLPSWQSHLHSWCPLIRS
jgi:hypothetical protein